jgi:hypothetical protein
MVGIMKRSEGGCGCVTLSTLFTLELEISMAFLEIEAENIDIDAAWVGIVKCSRVSWA